MCWENGGTDQQFTKNAARRPDVRLRPVMALSQQQFRWTIPQRHHYRRIALIPTVFQLPGQTEVGELYYVVVRHQDVRRLQISVKNHVLVQVGQGAEDLKHVPLDMHRRVSTRKTTHPKQT